MPRTWTVTETGTSSLTGPADDPFYQGYFIQIVAGLGDRAFADETVVRIEGGADPEDNAGSPGSGFRTSTATATWTSGSMIGIKHGWAWLNDGSGFLRPDPERNVRRTAGEASLR